MKTQAVTAAQIKQLKRTIHVAASDVGYTTEFMVAELKTARVAKSVIRTAVKTAAQRGIWLAVSDAAHRAFGLDLPEYAKATGRVRTLVDRSAARLSSQLAA